MSTPLRPWFPLAQSLSNYDRRHWRGDWTAGLTTAVMLVPQAMGYAVLAGLPPIYGLYSALVPIFLYALLGTSRQLAVGPVAMVSLLVASGVGQFAEAGTGSYIELAILLAGMVGALQLAMGLARVGFLVNFLSHSVIGGFTSAAALIIGLGQLKHLLGIALPRSGSVHVIIGQTMSQLSATHAPTVALAAASVSLLAGLKRWAPRWPRALVLVAATSTVTWALQLQTQGVAILGSVPAGLPDFALPQWNGNLMRDLLPTATTIALVGFMESIAVAKRYARDNRYVVDANQELIALGVANFVGSMFQAAPVTGGFARSAVNAQAGARSGVAGLVTALAVAMALLFLTPLFHYLPQAALAGIIVTAVTNLFAPRELRHLWKVKPSDAGMWVLTFGATLLLGIEEGIVMGVAASLGLLLFRTTRPHIAVLGRLPGTSVYRNIARHPDAQTTEGILLVRLDAQFYFGNISFLQEQLIALERALPGPLKHMVLDASGINQIDASAEAALRDIVLDYQRREIQFTLACVKGPVRDVLEASQWQTLIGSNAFALSVHDAVGTPSF